MRTTSNIAAPDEKSLQSRRRFILRFTAAAGTAALGSFSVQGNSAAAALSRHATLGVNTSSHTGSSDRTSVWEALPPITFTEGVAASISIAKYVKDADVGMLTIIKNSVALPAGVIYDAVTKSFIYDGVGEVNFTDGHILTSNEG